MTIEEALRTLGFDKMPTFEELRERFKELVFKTHPDHNDISDNGLFTAIKKAYDTLKKAVENTSTSLVKTGANETKSPIYLPGSTTGKDDELSENIKEFLEFLGEQVRNGIELLGKILKTGAKVVGTGVRVASPIVIAIYKSSKEKINQINETRKEEKETLKKLDSKKDESQKVDDKKEAGVEEHKNKDGITEHIPDSLMTIAQLALAVLEESDGLEFLKVPFFLRNNKEFMLKAIEINYEVIRFASKELRNNEDFMLSAAEIGCFDLITFAGDSLKDNIDFLIKVLLIDKNLFDEIDYNVKNNKEFIKQAIFIHQSIFKYYKSKLNYLLPELREDKNSIELLIKLYGLDVLNYINTPLTQDEEFMLKLCCYYGMESLEYSDLSPEQYISVYERALELAKMYEDLQKQEEQKSNVISFEEYQEEPRRLRVA